MESDSDPSSQPVRVTETAPAPPTAATSRILVKNTGFLMAAQLVAMPLSIIANAVMARYVGSKDFGLVYLAWTFAGLAFLFATWGSDGAVTGAIAQDRGRAGYYLGTALTQRVLHGLLACVVLVGIAHVTGHSSRFLATIGLVAAQLLILGIQQAILNVFRAFERSDVPALAHVGQQLLSTVLVIIVLMSGGGLLAALVAQAVATAIVALAASRALKQLSLGSFGIDWSQYGRLLVDGTPFFMFGLVLTLQPNIDAYFMDRYASPESIGWHAAAFKLIGTLLIPVTTLTGALYPTLVRLQQENTAELQRTAEKTLGMTCLIVVPIALGAGLYPDLGIELFNKETFHQAEMNLRFFSLFVLVIYFTMICGTVIVASGRQKIWTWVQVLCLFTSAGLDPLLIPYFQKHYGNGGLGVCVTMMVGEIVMLIGATVLNPRLILNSTTGVQFGKAVIAGVAMAGVSLALRAVMSPWIGVFIALAVYAVVLWQLRAISRDEAKIVTDFVARKVRRA